MFRVFALAVLALLAPLEGGGVMFAARQIFLGRSAKAAAPTAKSYVQDGLIAMWDGIENAGWGVHDPTATSRWIDLNNPSKYLTLQNVSITDNAVVFNGSFAYILKSQYSDYTSAAQNITTEMSFTLTSLNTAETHFVNTFYGDCWYDGRLIYNTNSKYIQTAVNLKWGQTSSHVITLVDDKSNPLQIYIDGALATTQIISRTRNYGNYFIVGNYSYTTSHYPLKAKVHNVRVYGRTLTADEIAANNAIDKERFNLP